MDITKGEWKAIPYKDLNPNAGGGWIVETHNGMIAHTSKANAHLIAASPRIAEWIAKVAKQGFTTFPEDRKVAREIIQELAL